MKLPVAHTLGNREASLDKDALMRNGLAEVDGDPTNGGIVRARKRPAIDSAFTIATGQGQALFTWTIPGALGPTEVLVGISNDTLAYGSSITTLTKALRFVQQPANGDLNTALSPSPSVEAIDKAGNRVTTYTGNITMALSTNPTSATLSGTLTVAASSGIATFSNLKSNRSGQGFVLGASASSVRSATSDKFNIPTHLVFSAQPSNTLSGQAISSFAVTAKDAAGNTDTNYTGTVTLSIFSGTGTLSGTYAVAASSGVATFTGAIITGADTFQLLATAGDVTGAYTPAKIVSNSFVVAPYLLGAGQSGFATGYISSLYGTLSPTTLFGATIFTLNSDTLVGETTLTLVGETYAQNFFTSITANGVTLLSSAATFSVGGGATAWQWVGTQLFTSAVTYPVTIT